ncbi:DNA cross-link repair 1A protein isoform X1 [Procambarus clarkii]|uniref:DNA cross-link repair 1A protein isoform X1 n=2 Tax=Procambarus clarkii TaxID=6728 RepID=UPI003744ACD7
MPRSQLNCSMISDDDDDIFCYTPLQRIRTQISSTQTLIKKEIKPSRLSLSQRDNTVKRFKSPLKKSLTNVKPRKSQLNFESDNKSSKLNSKNNSDIAKKSFLNGSSRFQASSASRAAPVSHKRKSAESALTENLNARSEQEKLAADVCPICMMPWKDYSDTGKSRDFHTDECLEIDWSHKTECKDGIDCCAIIESHFWNFTHHTMAEMRSEYQRTLAHNLSTNLREEEQEKQHKKTKKNPKSPSDDSGYEDLAVAGSSGLGKLTNYSKEKQQKPCSFSSQSDSTELNNSIPLFNLDSDDACDEFTSTFLAEKLSVKEPLSDVKITTNLNKLEQAGKKFSKHTTPSKILNKNDSAGNLANEEIPDLDVDSVMKSKCCDNEDNMKSAIFSEVASQGTRSPISDDDDDCDTEVFDENPTSEPFGEDCRGEENVVDSVKYNDVTEGPVVTSADTSSLPSISLLQDCHVGINVGRNDTPELEQNLNIDQNELQRITNGSNSDKCEPCCSKTGVEKDGDDEFEVDDDIFVRLVDAAVEKYLNNNKDERPHLKTSVKEQRCTKSSNKCPGKPSCQPCIHLHFHLNKIPEKSSKKVGQSSILNYFQPVKESQDSCKQTANKCASHCGSTCKKCKQTCGKSGAEGWKDLMSQMQRKIVKLPSVTDSSESTQRDEDKKPTWQQRKCPFYKYIPDTSFVVDAFFYGYLDGVSAYFLTHFHYDHYRGLKKSFSRPIYCSEITARLVKLRIGVSDQYIHPLPMEKPMVVCGIEVTLLEANHCPGAVMFLFKLRTGATVLHVGDFRANQKMESYPSLWNCSIDTLYLDTTYCKPLYDFPNQDDVIEKCVSIATCHIKNNSKTLIFVGAYSIGKERVFKAIATALDCRIWASNDRIKTLSCIQDEELQARLTSDKLCAQVHVVPMSDLKPKKLMDYIEMMKPRYTVGVAIRPTGWEHSSGDLLNNLSSKQFGNIYIYGIPYSEHSSYKELKRFVQFIQPKKIIPTVNIGNPSTRNMMEKEFSKWLSMPRTKSIDQLWKKK